MEVDRLVLFEMVDMFPQYKIEDISSMIDLIKEDFTIIATNVGTTPFHKTIKTVLSNINSDVDVIYEVGSQKHLILLSLLALSAGKDWNK